MDEEVALWMKQADDSLQVARDNFGLKHFHVTVFRCHHAVESALKGLWIQENGPGFPKTHVLEKLVARTSLPKRFHQFLAELSPEATATRYADIADKAPSELYDDQHAKYCLTKSMEVIRWMKQKL